MTKKIEKIAEELAKGSDRAQTKLLVDEYNVLPVFHFADEVVKYLLPRIKRPLYQTLHEDRLEPCGLRATGFGSAFSFNSRCYRSFGEKPKVLIGDRIVYDEEYPSNGS